MNTIDDLRAALDDEPTPAGIDVGAVRRRAGRQRRATVAATAAAAAAVTLAVTLPLAATRGSTPPSVKPGPPGAADCPNSFPAGLGNSGPGLDGRLVPMAVDGVLACEYYGAFPDRQPPPPAAFQRLTTSRVLPARAGRALLATFEQGAFRHPPTCTAPARSSILLQVTGAGRTVRLRVDPFGCGLVTNGTAARFAGTAASADLPALLSRTPSRLSCPARPGSQPGPDRNAPPAKHLVSFVPDRLVFCRYGPMPATGLDQRWGQEVDGAGAAEVMRRLDRLPDFQYTPCALPPGDTFQYEVVLTGQGQRATLSGSDNGCSVLASAARMVAGVNWFEVLNPEGLPR